MVIDNENLIKEPINTDEAAVLTTPKLVKELVPPEVAVRASYSSSGRR